MTQVKETITAESKPVTESDNLKSGFEIFTEVEEATVYLSNIPTILLMLLEDFGFENRELTDDDIFTIRVRHDMISDIIYMTRNLIIDTVEKLNNISLTKNNPEETKNE